jgi:hypothetical protein
LVLAAVWVASECLKLGHSFCNESIHSSNEFNNASKIEDIHTKNVQKEDANRIQAELDKELKLEKLRHNNQLNEDATRIETETKSQKSFIDYKNQSKATANKAIKPSGNLGGKSSSTASPETPAYITQKKPSYGKHKNVPFSIL